MDAVFLSDLHLKSLKERKGETLLRFLTSLAERPEPPPQIFLLGDIFDLWISDHSVFLSRYEGLTHVLQALGHRGARVVYFEGNHDMHLAIFWQDVLGAEVYTRPKIFEINGLKIRCEHGDEINQDDLSYLRLRAFLRSPAMEKLAHRLPGKVLDYLGNKWSGHSRQRSSVERQVREENIRQLIRRHAELTWVDEKFDAIISGHMHVKDDWSFDRDGREIRAINLGSWFEGFEVLTLTGQQFEWLDLSEAAV